MKGAIEALVLWCLVSLIGGIALGAFMAAGGGRDD